MLEKSYLKKTVDKIIESIDYFEDYGNLLKILTSNKLYLVLEEEKEK